MRHTFLVLATLLATAAATGAAAQQPTGRLLGAVYDSTAMTPLGGATLTVPALARQAVADAQGRFFFPGLPPGSYRIEARHPRLDTLGIMVLVRESVTVTAGSTTTARLAAPPMARLLGELCAGAEGGPSRAVAGFVTDAVTGVPLPGAAVRLMAPPGRPGDRPQRPGRALRRALDRATTPSPAGVRVDAAGLETVTDARGRYVVCGLPAGTMLAAQATFMNAWSPAETFHVGGPGGAAAVRGLSIRVTEPGRITGRLTDRGTGAPIVAATVQVADAGIGVLTDADGRFAITPLAPGQHQMVVTHVAYGQDTTTVRAVAGRTTEVELSLEPEAIALDAIRVTAPSALEREQRMRGTPVRVLTRQEIEELSIGSRNAAQLLGNVTGLVLHADRPFSFYGPCIESTQRIRSLPAGNGAPAGARASAGCQNVMIVLDGIMISDIDLHGDRGRQLLAQLQPDDIESIEYLKPGEAGLRYGTLAGSGVVEIYTRGNGPYARQPRPLQAEAPRAAVDLAMMGIGTAAGAVVVASVTSCVVNGCPFGDLNATAAAAQMGAAGLAVPFAIHRAGRSGPFWTETLVSLGIGAAGVAAWEATGSPGVLVGASLLQIGVTVWLEWR